MNFLDNYLPMGIYKQKAYKDIIYYMYMEVLTHKKKLPGEANYIYRPTMGTLANMVWNYYGNR